MFIYIYIYEKRHGRVQAAVRRAGVPHGPTMALHIYIYTAYMYTLHIYIYTDNGTTYPTRALHINICTLRIGHALARLKVVYVLPWSEFPIVPSCPHYPPSPSVDNRAFTT